MEQTDRPAAANSVRQQLVAAGLSDGETDRWLEGRPDATADFDADLRAFSAFLSAGQAFLARLSPKPNRNAAEIAAADALRDVGADARHAFLQAHCGALYDRLTERRAKHLRVEALLEAGARLMPGLVPGEQELADEAARTLREKEGLERQQGLFLSHVLADRDTGLHLCHAMLLPKPESREQADVFRKAGHVDLGATRLERHGKAVIVEMRNPQYLNAIDMTTIGAIETAIDVAILDTESEIAVLRGGPVTHPKYAGQRIFSAGINLTHLYTGKIPLLFYFHHLMGFEHKIFRGLAQPETLPDDIDGRTREKAWIAVVEKFAIGGGCQHLLVADYVLAGADAYLTLPARKEGIIPGAANLRLPRFVGNRTARQAILYERRFECDSPQGRLICDEIAPADGIDDALDRVIDGYTTSGVVSIVGNRRQLRIGEEPLDTFRTYLAQHALEQSECHFSDGLINNLERFWTGRK